MSELSTTTDAGREMLDLPAREILTAFRNRQLSPVEYMTALIARVEASEPKVKALYLFRPEEALEEARAAEARYAKGAPAGCLDGMPVTIKELIATKGDPVPVGTAATELEPAPADAPTAARLREEGAILYAKTTCPDYGMLTSGLSMLERLWTATPILRIGTSWLRWPAAIALLHAKSRCLGPGSKHWLQASR